MRTTKPKTHFEGKRSGSTGPEIAVVLKHNLKHPIFRVADKKQNLFDLDIGEESDVFGYWRWIFYENVFTTILPDMGLLESWAARFNCFIVAFITKLGSEV